MKKDTKDAKTKRVCALSLKSYQFFFLRERERVREKGERRSACVCFFREAL